MCEDTMGNRLRPVLFMVAAITLGLLRPQSAEAAATDMADYMQNTLGIDLSGALVFGWNAVVPPTSSSQLAEIEELNFGVAMYEVSGELRFTFVNGTTENNVLSTISDIYFDDGSANELGVFFNSGHLGALTSSGTDFSFGNASNPDWNFSEGNNVLPPFETTDTISVQRNGARANGLDPLPEYLTLEYAYTSGNSLASVASAFNSGDIRIAMHVIGIGQSSFSESVIWTPLNPGSPPPPPGPYDPNPVVPLPGTALLGLAGFGTITVARRTKARQANS